MKNSIIALMVSGMMFAAPTFASDVPAAAGVQAPVQSMEKSSPEKVVKKHSRKNRKSKGKSTQQEQKKEEVKAAPAAEGSEKKEPVKGDLVKPMKHKHINAKKSAEVAPEATPAK